MKLGGKRGRVACELGDENEYDKKHKMYQILKEQKLQKMISINILVKGEERKTENQNEEIN